MSNSVAPAIKTANNEIPWNPKVRQKKQPSDYVVDFLIGLLVVAVVVVVLYPLWFIVIASFSNSALVSQGAVTLYPKDINFSGYTKILEDSRIWTGYKNTIIYSVIGTAVNMLVTLPVAFSLSRREFKARRIILFLFTFTMFFAGGLIPSYLLFKDLGILNSMWVFILPGAVNVFNVIIARSFFETSIPEELHDAAQVDVGHWNDFFTGLIYIRNQEKQPLQNVLQNILLANQMTTSGGGSDGRSMLERQQAADQIKYGIIIVSTLPLLVVYPFLQKYFNKGVMIGAVKG